MTDSTHHPLLPQEQIAGETAYGDNGWRRQSVWTGDQAGGFSEDAIDGFTIFYEHAGGAWCGETSYYVELTETVNQPDVRPAYVVNCTDHTFKQVKDDDGNYLYDTEKDEYDYDGGSVLYYDTFESAMEEARRQAMTDWSFAYFNPEEVSA